MKKGIFKHPIPSTTAIRHHFLLALSITFLSMTNSITTSSSAKNNASPRFRTWPITATQSLEQELRRMGLKIPAESIDGTSSASRSDNTPRPLSDALVSVGPAGRGGTGSFVSSNGLILTNWHVAYDAVRQASLKSAENTDYVKDGFVSKKISNEIPGPNYEVWITKTCVDVSQKVKDVISSEKEDALKRANKVRDIMQEIAQSEQKKHNGSDGGIRCDVQEMLPNESYVLFTYERLRDVRIVYVPPKSLGNFGGDNDNFEWPRHTADFTLLRAYVSPNGDAADYHPDNIPYQSKAYIKVQKNGASEGEMVFLLGFPGSTMRYAPTSRLSYSDEVAVPNMVKDFSRKLQLISKYKTESLEVALKLGSSEKSLANELKRSKGKLVMMRKLGLIDERKMDEEELCNKSSDAKVALDRLADIYNTFRTSKNVSSALQACRGVYAGSALMAAGHAVHEYIVIEKSKPDENREASYRERNLPFLCKRLGKRLVDIHVPHEVALIQDALQTLSGNAELDALRNKIIDMLGDDVTSLVEESKLRNMDGKTLQDLITNVENEKDDILNDPFVKCASVLWDTYEHDRDTSKALLSERDLLFAKLLDLQRKYASDDNDDVMYPDCNGSLRISAGYVEGYKAADAVEYKPSTTLAGLFDKVVEAKLLNTDSDSNNSDEKNEFDCPQRLCQMLSSSSNDNDSIKKVPVCLLYSTDTVGGNSGSPVMNAQGEFVAINFDRQRQGLMNEFKWSKDYSRSIGVDVRYILWLIGDYDGASHLVDEILS